MIDQIISGKRLTFLPGAEEGVEKDHFVHISGLVDEIREGDTVEFDLQEGNKGLNAVNVKVI